MVFIVTMNTLVVFGQDEHVDYRYEDGLVIAEFERLENTEELDLLLSKIGSSESISDSLNRISSERYTESGWELIYMDDQKIVYQKSLGNLATSSFEEHIFIDEDPIAYKQKYNLDVRYGVNKFKRESVRQKEDSIFTFKYAGNSKVGSVYLSGTFNDWSTMSIPMKKNGDQWQVDIALNEGKHLYKFIVDGRWITDPFNLQNEDDYQGNNNSVFFVANYSFRLKGYTDAKRVYLSGNFNDWRESELRMKINNGTWELPIYLDEGIHSYKFIVDKEWILDPANPSVRSDGQGNENSFITSGEPFIFKTEAFDTADELILCGSFNNWNETELPMIKKWGKWEVAFPVKPGNYEYKYIVDGVWRQDPYNPHSIGYDEYKNSVFSVAANYTFKLIGYEDADEVLLTGSFNNWSESGYTMKKVGSIWLIQVYLPKGKTQYKFIVDGEWIKDATNPLYEKNQYGSFDSILWIK